MISVRGMCTKMVCASCSSSRVGGAQNSQGDVGTQHGDAIEHKETGYSKTKVALHHKDTFSVLNISLGRVRRKLVLRFWWDVCRNLNSRNLRIRAHMLWLRSGRERVPRHLKVTQKLRRGPGYETQ